MNILDYGAVGDNKTVNTRAIQRAIDACHQRGGGQVVIPSGNFISGTLFLKSNVELHLMHNARLIASQNLDDYNTLDIYPQNWGSAGEEWVGKHLLIAVNQTNVAISGHGTIDGNGDFFFEEPQKTKGNYGWVYGIAKARNKKTLRPGQVLCLIECSHIHVTDITVVNSPCWCLYLHGCDYATLRGIKVFNRPYHANTDGIDIDTCRYVTVSDCIIDTGDDAIAIRCDAEKLTGNNKRCEYISVSNCVLASTICAFRVGVGTGEICNITVSNINVSRCSRIIRFMTAYSARGSALLHDMSFSNIVANNTAYPFTLEEANDSYIRNIIIQDFHVHAYCGISITAVDPSSISDISIRNIDITIEEPPYEVDENEALQRGDHPVFCRNADNILFDNVKITIPPELQCKWKGMYHTIDCNNVQIRHCNFTS